MTDREKIAAVAGMGVAGTLLLTETVALIEQHNEIDALVNKVNSLENSTTTAQNPVLLDTQTPTPTATFNLTEAWDDLKATETKMAITNTPTQTPTPTATITPSETPTVDVTKQINNMVETIVAETATAPTKIMVESGVTIVTETPTATETPTPTETATEVDNSQYTQNDNWDGQTTAPENPNGDSVFNWNNNMLNLVNNKKIEKGDVRSFDKQKEVTNFNEDFPYFVKTDGTLPMAKEVLKEEQNIGIAVLKEAGISDPKLSDAKKLGNTIIQNSFTVNGQTLTTKNFFPEDKAGVLRKDQEQTSVCSMYVPWIEIGKEINKNGILYESNKAKLVMFFAVTNETPTTNEPETLHQTKILDINGNSTNVYWRWEDWSSQPGKDAGIDKPTNSDGHGWQSTIGVGCGETVPAPSKLMVQSGIKSTPVPTAENTNQPTVTATKNIVLTTPPTKEVPTATFIIPTATKPENTQVPPTKVHPTSTNVPPTEVPPTPVLENKPGTAPTPTPVQPTAYVAPTLIAPTPVPATEIPHTAIPAPTNAATPVPFGYNLSQENISYGNVGMIPVLFAMVGSKFVGEKVRKFLKRKNK